VGIGKEREEERRRGKSTRSERLGSLLNGPVRLAVDVEQEKHPV